MKKPTRQERQAEPKIIEPKTPGESLFLERALAYYRETQVVGDNAAYGQVLNEMDAFAFINGRDLARQGLQIALQERVDEIEKNKQESVKKVPKNKTQRIPKQNHP